MGLEIQIKKYDLSMFLFYVIFSLSVLTLIYINIFLIPLINEQLLFEYFVRRSVGQAAKSINIYKET